MSGLPAGALHRRSAHRVRKHIAVAQDVASSRVSNDARRAHIQAGHQAATAKARSVSDAVAIALITGASTGLVGIIGAYLAFLTGRRQAKAALDTVRAQGDIEIRRLHEQFREDERRRRQDLYADALAALNTLDAMGNRLQEVTAPKFERWALDYYDLSNRLQLFTPAPVRSALINVETALSRLFVKLKDPADDAAYAQSLIEAWEGHRGTFTAVLSELRDAMRADVAVHVPGGSPTPRQS